MILQADMYPYLLVTIGSGVSIIKVVGDEKFERIGGTATGGGTFWGLGKEFNIIICNATAVDKCWRIFLSSLITLTHNIRLSLIHI